VVRDDAEGRALVDALRSHRWHEALFERRGMFGRDAGLWLFGHALMEKLVAPRKAITAHVRVAFAPSGYVDMSWDERRGWLDAFVAGELAADGLGTTSFTPLPVLGVPGWWPGQDEVFYGDASVFRPKRATSKENS
jgi:hypothetical protein